MRQLDNRGFTLLEVIIVVSIMVVVYTYGMPKFNNLTGTETSIKITRLAADVRSAYDLAVLSNHPYRMVFMIMSGDYWLETADGQALGGALGGVLEGMGVDNSMLNMDVGIFNHMPFYLSDEKHDRELTTKDEESAQSEFDATFDEYKDLAGAAVEDTENDRILNPKSPLLSAKEWLRPPRWTKVQSNEWGKARSLGPHLVIKDMQVEHQDNKQQLHGAMDSDRALIYFFPRGYVERSYIHIAVRKGDNEVDEGAAQYTLTTHPYLGTAEVTPGYQEINLLDET